MLVAITTAPAAHRASLLEAACDRLVPLAGAAEPPLPDEGADMHMVEAGDVATVRVIHARNILCALMRDFTTGPLLNRIVPALYAQAVSGFASPNFSLRNTSLLLFAALQSRIVGTKVVRQETSQQNLLSARKFFALYPAVRTHMLERLPPLIAAAGAISNPELFLHLSALCWLRTSPMEASRVPRTSTAEFRPLLVAAAGSADWSIRRLAARARANLEPPSELAAMAAAVDLGEGEEGEGGRVLILLPLIQPPLSQ